MTAAAGGGAGEGGTGAGAGAGAGPVVAVVPLRGGGHGKSRLAAHLSPAERTRLVEVLAQHVVATLLGSVDRVLVLTADLSHARRVLAPVAPEADLSGGGKRAGSSLPPAHLSQDLGSEGSALQAHARDLRSDEDCSGAGRLEILEQARAGLNGAVADGVEAALSRGAARVLVIHADLPLLASDDVAALLAETACPGSRRVTRTADSGPNVRSRSEAPVILAPDEAGEGTNALVLDRSVSGFRFRFGAGSAAAHRAEAERLGIVPRIVRRPGTALDLDTPADLAALPLELQASLRQALSP